MPKEMVEIVEEPEVAEATEALKKTVNKVAEDAGRLPGRYANETLVPEGGE
jgi:ribonuclease D